MDGKPHTIDEPRNTRRPWRALLVLAALSLAAEAAVQLHPHFGIESLFGFHAWFGLGACAATVVVAKALALLLERPDIWYGGRDD